MNGDCGTLRSSFLGAMKSQPSGLGSIRKGGNIEVGSEIFSDWKQPLGPWSWQKWTFCFS